MKFFTRMRRPKVLIALTAGVSFIVLCAAYEPNRTPRPFHSEAEMTKMMMLQGDLPSSDNGYFIGSGKCAGCHGIDPIGLASITEDGTQVNPAENWRATMMANSAKDPLWRAKVAHEVSINPGHEQALVNKCTSCHAPVGKYSHEMSGNPNFTMEDLVVDSLARDGVNCGACHQQRTNNRLGKHFSGHLDYSKDSIWGPLFNIPETDMPLFDVAMTSFVGYTPLGDPKVSQSEYCAACHTLITETADLEGNLTGTDFIEQATYHEWLNSAYNTDDPTVNKECQTCHMPRLNEPVVVASGYAFLPHREPYAQHWFVGANSFMLGILKNNIETLGVTAQESHFDVVLDRTLHNLQTNTGSIEIIEGVNNQDSARYTLKVTNKAGHKLPSGYPSRIAYIEFVATDDNGNEIFHSGGMDNNYNIIGNDPLIEPHYDLITSQDQVQVYEMVMGDVNGGITTVLERAHHTLKDNRLVPLGFSTSHAAYDSTQIVGPAINDPNFNHLNGVEGSGTDEIRFHIPLNGFSGNLHVTAKLMYQTVPPKWTTELFSVDEEHINLFESMYNQAGAAPVVVSQTTAQSIITSINSKKKNVSIGPNPTSNGQVTIQTGTEVMSYVNVYSITGQWMDKKVINGSRASIWVPEESGTYILEIKTNKGVYVERIIRR